MQHLRIAITLLLFTLFIVSCNNQKEKNQPVKGLHVSVSEEPGITDTHDEVNTESYINGFAASATQQFTVPHERISVVTGKKGLKITIDPSRLVKEDGSAVDGKINVQMIELTNSLDLFRSNTATISDGRLLASGGSYFIGLECSGQQLKLKTKSSLQVSFPVIDKNEMQLFYGERDSNGSMNWKIAGVLLEQQPEEVMFTDTNRFEVNNIPPVLSEIELNKVFKSLDESVYYYNTKMTLQKLVDTLNAKKAKVFIQTISYWPKNLPTDVVLDTNYLISVYGPQKQYILRTCSSMEAEQKEKLKMMAARDSALSAWKPRSLAGQIQKYYAPAALTKLGWINCDRFNDRQNQMDVEVDLPIAFNKSRVDYFVIFHSFNGLVSNRATVTDSAKMILMNMPQGEKVTLVAFTKKNGLFYQLKESFVIGKNRNIAAGFSAITETELKNIFAGNVKI